MNKDLHENITDQELLQKFYHSHDNAWLGVLLKRYTLLLLGVCMKYLKNEEEAKDAVQQVFLKTITELHKYKVDYFKSWIHMVAKNHCLMKLRDGKGKNVTGYSENLLLQSDEPTDKQRLINDDKTYDLMLFALKELNAEQQQCVTLFYLNKKSYQEIAEATGFTVMQVKSYIQNGKRNLKILIEKKMNDKGI